MKTKKVWTLAFCIALSLNLVAQTGSKYTVEEAAEMVKQHNYHRAAVGVQAVKWSNEVAAHAQEWANHLANSSCSLNHRKKNKYGENLFWGYGQDYSPSYVSDYWAREKKDWHGGKITMQNFSKAGHYTQMIWYSTTEIGCGQAVCSDGSLIVVCNYNPPGNMIGRNPEGK